MLPRIENVMVSLALKSFLLLVLVWNCIDDQVLANLRGPLHLPMPSQAVLTAPNVYLPLAYFYRAQILQKIRQMAAPQTLNEGWASNASPISEVLFLQSSLQL